MKEPEQKISRRDFLKHMCRSAAIGGIAFGVLRLKKRKQLDISCINNSYCPPCSINKNCNLPQALSYRKNRKSGADKT